MNTVLSPRHAAELLRNLVIRNKARSDTMHGVLDTLTEQAVLDGADALAEIDRQEAEAHQNLLRRELQLREPENHQRQIQVHPTEAQRRKAEAVERRKARK